MSWQAKKPPFVEHKKKILRNSAKVSKFIFQIGEYSALRKPSRKVPLDKLKSADYIKKFKHLKACLLKYRRITGYGRGITAVQIGIPERFSIIYTPEKLIIIINPKIIKKSSKLLIYPEGCMSASPIIAPTIRPAWIDFEYFDEDGKKQFWNTKDDSELNRMMNRVSQHEIDHMDGVINIDKIKNPKDLILESDPDFYSNAKFEEVG